MTKLRAIKTRLRYPALQVAGTSARLLHDRRYLHCTRPPDYDFPPLRYDIPREVSCSFKHVNCFFRSFGEVIYHCDTKVRVDRNGLILKGTSVLNPPVVDDLGYLEKMIRQAALRSLLRPMSLVGRPVISLRHVWEDNYFHIINDIYPRLKMLAARASHDAEPVVLASPTFLRSSLCRFLLSTSPRFARIQFVPQTTEILCDDLWFGSTSMLDRRNYDVLLNDLPVDRSEWLNREERIFVSRRSSEGRGLENADTIERIVRRHNFKVLYPGELSFLEQVERFASARWVVGIHGAAMTNLIFRAGARTGLLELFPPVGSYPAHFYNVCRMYGFDYRCIVGERGRAAANRGGRFAASEQYNSLYIDPDAFEAALDTHLSS